jgi:hypothetical protein
MESGRRRRLGCRTLRDWRKVRFPGRDHGLVSDDLRLIQQRRWLEAVEALALAVRLDPLDGASHFYLAVAAAHSGDFRRAEHAWKTFLRLPDARGSLGDLARRALQAVTELRSTLDEVPG